LIIHHALAFGGRNPSSKNSSNRRMEWYFLDRNNRFISTARQALAGAGTSTSALAFGGQKLLP
jgi:hypothetical protein